jgi:hypothetical protein
VDEELATSRGRGRGFRAPRIYEGALLPVRAWASYGLVFFFGCYHIVRGPVHRPPADAPRTIGPGAAALLTSRLTVSPLALGRA